VPALTGTTIDTALAYYAASGAALFPIPAGQKKPTGIIQSFKHDFSRDPTQWRAWADANPGCNFGVVAFASNWIIVDIDTSGGADGRDEAWATWCGLCAEWGVAPAAPHVQSASGGWHVYFAVPEGIDAASLRQPDAVKKRINIRCLGYTVAAGSYYDNSLYILISEAPPHPAPEALVRHCTRAGSSEHVVRTGDRDRDDVATLVEWLAERDAFESYEDWLHIGMALKLEYGDDGLSIWQVAHDDTVDEDIEASKWQSFASEPNADSVTLSTFLDRAHKLGWRGSVRKSAASMFGEAGQVAALAAATGATLPGPIGSVPMLAGQEKLAEYGRPIVEELLALTDIPLRPSNSDHPTLPEACSGHGLYTLLCDAIERILAMSEDARTWKATRVNDVLGVLSIVHQDTADAICRRIRTAGRTLPERPIKLAAAALSDKVERAFVGQDDWIRDVRGDIENDNSDNVAVFLGILGIDIRWNVWLDRAEIRGGSDPSVRWPEWTYIDDTAVAKLRTRGNRTKTRFRPGKDFMWESLLALAQDNPRDPAVEHIDALQAAWDGKPRLAVWLSATCGVPCDPYHQAVGRNIIGGMVRRVRQPGCKHDTMAVFLGPQGTGKSTLASILAMSTDWFSETVQLGDASKELILSLAGKCVVEIAEMGMRGNGNPNHVKAMLSTQYDEGRTAYARSVTRRPRRNIFVGTTNDDEPLMDNSGNRRFLPIRVTSEINLEWLRENIDQLVGEAATIEAAGETFALPRAIWGVAAEHQESARAMSDIETRIEDWFAPTEMAGSITWITASDLVEISEMTGWRSGSSNTARGAAMRAMCFENMRVTLGGKKIRAWVRRPADTLVDPIKFGTRYVVGKDPTGRARVEIRAPGTV